MIQLRKQPALMVLIGFLLGYGFAPRSDPVSPNLRQESSSQSTSSGTSSGRGTEVDEISSSSSSLVFDIPPSVKSIIINVGSNLDPILPNKDMGPCAHSIAIEPIVGCQIPPHPQLSVIDAAVSSAPGVTSMNIYNANGESSSLARPAKANYWNTQKARGDGKLKMVPVITLSSVVNAIPDTATIALVKTDMQGFDFVAIKEASSVLKKRVKHLLTEIWLDDVYTYAAQNDLCRDWLPFMTELGYTLTKLGVVDVTTIKARCEKQLKDHPQRPEVAASAGLNENNAHWIRNDAVDEPFPECKIITKLDTSWSEQDYATCG